MKKERKQQNIVIYRDKKGNVELKADIDKETIWATQEQIAQLFGTQRPAITKHLNNIFKNSELIENSVRSILEHTATDGKVYKTQFYNLDAILSVGYRVNSKQATAFRVWATKTLRDYIVKGYVLNQKRLKESDQNSLKELNKTISLIQNVAFRKQLEQSEMANLLSVIHDYANSWLTLKKYDEGDLTIQKGKAKTKKQFTYDFVRPAVDELKNKLMEKGEASDLFSNERDGSFDGILKTIYQTFDGRELYESLEEKAAHLLYFIIKDHPFSDGNKRVGAFLFVFFLDQNKILHRKNGEKKINDNTLVAIALLVAESNPNEKEQMVALITQLIK